MNWWYLGAVGAAKHRKEKEDFPSKYQNVALIVGVTGMSGNSLADILALSDTPGGRWKVYGVAQRPQPEWQFHHHIHYIQCDMANPQETQSKLSNLNDVTHIFYVGWVNKYSEAENSIHNGKLLHNVLNALIPNAPNLQHICLQTSQICCYTMEDILFEEVQKNPNLTWSVHRPATMLGFSPYSTRNIVGSLCVYATICKHQGLPLKFPGSRAAWDGYSEVADADLVAEQQIWAALEHPGKRQTFNITNGDVFKWKDLWGILAEKFQVKFVEFEEGVDSLEEIMRDKSVIWDEIVEQKELLPTKLEEIGTWSYVDFVLRRLPVLDSENSHTMDKSKEYGFGGRRDTLESFRFWIQRTKTYKIVP